ncbi:MAG TPA: alpha/beta hydrolase [Solirubrobacteraceae bacterium]|nr:alpha/beta hydrolase [Solirubrobacteraceae bacterium]
MAERVVERDGVSLSVSDDGAGVAAVVLLHGLTASRRYVVMGSRALERDGHRVVAYDARGHGRSSRAVSPDAYSYADLAGDLVAVLDGLGIARAVLAGASMGAHTLLRLALSDPDRVAGAVVITPGYDPASYSDPGRLAHWAALSDGLREGGIEGFLAAYDLQSVPAGYRDTVEKVIRQRMALHSDLGAVADALRVVPGSAPFDRLEQLGALAGVRAAVVASADGPDPEHPQALGEAYAAAIPGARLVLDQPGRSPIAWQGSQLSAVIAEVAGRAQW